MKRKVLVKGLVVVVCLFMLSAPSVMAQEPCEADFNCDGNVDATDVDVFLADFGRSPFNNPCPDCYDSPCPCTPAPVSKTGQTTLYATGDDGDLQKGVAWPNPRFTDNGNETVSDNLTGLIWKKDANLPESTKTWQEAIDYVDEINKATYHFRSVEAEDDYVYEPITYSGESFTLELDFDLAEVTWSGGMTLGLFCDDMYDGGNVYRFTAGVADGGRLFSINFNGQSDTDYYNYSFDNWYRLTITYDATSQTATATVRDLCTDTVVSTLEATGISPQSCISRWGISAYGANDEIGYSVGEIDNLSLVIDGVPAIDTDFSEDPDFITPDPSDFYWHPNAPASGDCGAVKSDWRLPNYKELFSLVDAENYDPPLPSGHPFNNVQLLFYWSSTTRASTSDYAWGVPMGVGHVYSQVKTSYNYVWPVRGGQ